MTVVAKMDGRLVEIVRVVQEVQFSNTPGWVLICLDFEQADRKKTQFKWLPASTRFEWVRSFAF